MLQEHKNTKSDKNFGFRDHYDLIIIWDPKKGFIYPISLRSEIFSVTSRALGDIKNRKSDKNFGF